MSTSASPESETILSKSSQETKSVGVSLHKSPERLYNREPSSMAGCSPNSLNLLMSGRSSLKSLRVAFPLEYDVRQQTKEVSLESYGYGYGYGADDDDKTPKPKYELPATKRRRFQRRNSKTPAMLMSMNSSLLIHLDFLEDKKEYEAATTTTASPSSTAANKSPDIAGSPLKLDSWDGGLEIAEELVKHLQKRRQSNS